MLINSIKIVFSILCIASLASCSDSSDNLGDAGGLFPGSGGIGGPAGSDGINATSGGGPSGSGGVDVTSGGGPAGSGGGGFSGSIGIFDGGPTEDGATAGGGGSTDVDTGVGGTGGDIDVPVGDPSQWNDPGDQPFVPVPEGEVAAECKMDINLLRSSGIIQAHAVIRYGKLCYSSGNQSSLSQIFSATKTVAGTVMGAARWDTRNNARQMFPNDLVSDWGASTNPSLRIAHLASMVAGSLSLDYNSLTFAYDTMGTNLARTGPPMNVSLGEGSVSGARSVDDVKNNLFRKLGITGSFAMGTAMWGTGANFSLFDMARIGIVLIHGGWYNGEQVVDPDWVYWMTHPGFESANTSYGMYTWLNHRGNASGIGGDLDVSGAGPSGGDPCAPAAIWQRYPHPPSEAMDCNPEGGNSCEQQYDTGVFSAQGLGGQFIIGHRGLDLVMVVKNYSGQGGPLGMWEAIRPAVVALDPQFQGDEAAFCEAYGNGNYAPDLLVHPVQPN